MESNPQPVNRLIEQFRKLPGVGRKGAQRMAFYLLSLPQEEGLAFAEAVADACSGVKRCSVCCNLSTDDICPICSSPKRDRKLVCAVETPEDLMAIERGGGFRGTYHILGGALSPIDDVGPDDLNIAQLLRRVSEDGVEEVILATNSNVEGEATALYISKLLKPLGVRATRLASGLPVGSNLQYADSVTLQKAIDGRQEL
ncbi:MAG: recombination mediator RecR [Clostridia bacterium]|nr:recombination mediator RecR [Clostridia bacterium]